MESFTFGSDEGMVALVKAMQGTGGPYPVELNPADFGVVVYALRAYAEGATGDEDGDPDKCDGHDQPVCLCRAMRDGAWSLLSGIAGTLGIEFV